ncbi:DMSO/TMAO reductase YedYZ molybdopterin-dependent catalytic subunit [Bradyrhizobium sp. i1.8.4]|uniref:sulfite oxidase n=1 Tax=unclassified Bradyrhizobium TaxID=2631580 RepID=UPI003D19A678
MDGSRTDYMDNTSELSSAGLTIRQREPKNLESPFDRIDSYLTPTGLFYIRSHFPVPALDRASYQLKIDGAVKHPLTLSYDELRSMPSETHVATLECAGNGRVFLVPQVQGAQWELGAVSNAEWTGVPLRVLLERAGLVDDACEIVLEGADRGTPKEEPVPPEPISYAWSLPRAKAIRPEVLIAYQMNGRDLPRDHGFPVRAVVPGYYGMSSVKWLTRIQAVREPFRGYWNTSDYGYWASMEGMPVRRALGEMQLKSEIARPRVYETVIPNQVYTVFGAAWAGETDVTEIAVSTDGGRTWTEAEFIDPVRRHAWRRWKFEWLTPEEPGQYTLLARAKDASGVMQPDRHDKNHGTYVINHPLPIEVFVDGSGGKRL